MELKYARYSLEPLVKLNRKADFSIRAGVHLKVDDIYYLDYCPWETFGDLSVNDFLKSIKVNGLPDYLLTLLDLEKRKNEIKEVSFFNHGFNSSQEIVNKIKVTDNLEVVKQYLKLKSKVKYRFDFNGGYNLSSIVNLWQELSKEEKSKIDYFEDPIDDTDWSKLKEYKIPLARDRVEGNKFDFEVFKPNSKNYITQGKTKIYSSYMGHKLGVYHAYLHMLEFSDLNQYHGIVTPSLYKNQECLFNKKGTKFFINKNSVSQMYQELRGKQWKSL